MGKSAILIGVLDGRFDIKDKNKFEELKEKVLVILRQKMAQSRTEGNIGKMEKIAVQFKNIGE